MNEEQLADLLAQHLDTWLAEDSLPENLPTELAGLLPLAHSLTETAPVPRSEFGPALKASLLGSTGSGNGAPPAANSAWGGLALSVVVMGLIGGLVVISLLVTVFIFWGSNSTAPSMPTVTPVAQPTQTTLPTLTATPPVQAIPTVQATPAQITLTATPVIDLLPVITITVEIKIEPPALVPGSSGGGGNNGGGSGDQDKGHGNDDDHQDDDNPGKGGKE
jgi:hypothetical protein